MAINVVIEDGTNVPNANSYVTLAEAREYAANRGVTLPTDNDVLASAVIRSTDYLESKRCEYQGSKTNSTQPLQWPRTGVLLNGDELAPNVIPYELKAAQFQAIIADASGIKLQGDVTAKSYVVREKVGPIEREYSDPTKAGISPVLTAVDAWLAPLFGTCGQFVGGLRTIRV